MFYYLESKKLDKAIDERFAAWEAKLYNGKIYMIEGKAERTAAFERVWGLVRADLDTPKLGNALLVAVCLDIVSVLVVLYWVVYWLTS